MFIICSIVDSIRVPSQMMALPTVTALHSEIDKKYPNRVLADVGLAICRYGSCTKISHGACVPGDGGSHHECLVKLIVFRPFVDEVCLGTIVRSAPEGVQVSLGFFQDIFIPAYWMLRPSHFDESTRLWVWTPKYDDDDEGKDGNDYEEANADAVGVKSEPDANGDVEEGAPNATKGSTAVKLESPSKTDDAPRSAEQEEEGEGAVAAAAAETGAAGGDRFEMHIGAQVRFRVKSIHFTQVVNTAKGVQSTTTTTAHSHAMPTSAAAEDDAKKKKGAVTDKPQRQRSSSLDVGENLRSPASMNIVASICEDGLGLTSWWEGAGDDDDEEAASNDGAQGQEIEQENDHLGGDDGYDAAEYAEDAYQEEY